jgi:taurine dioxygenase
VRIEASGKVLGATVEEIDLARPMPESDFRQILRALGARGVLCFPGQRIETGDLARFGRLFGELEVRRVQVMATRDYARLAA